MRCAQREMDRWTLPSLWRDSAAPVHEGRWRPGGTFLRWVTFNPRSAYRGRSTSSSPDAAECSTSTEGHARDIHSSGGPADSARDMMHSASLPQPGPGFDAFLFAPVGDDKNGMQLSVLSALARLDVDPWQEAADLARLPRSTAIERLASLVAALPGRPASQLDPGTIAVRLIALLPGRTDPNVPPRAGLPGGGKVIDSQAIVRVVAINLILVVVMLGAQWLVVSHVSSAQVAEAPAATSQTIPAQALPPNPGQ